LCYVLFNNMNKLIVIKKEMPLYLIKPFGRGVSNLCIA
jgi:hypothetical protein